VLGLSIADDDAGVCDDDHVLHWRSVSRGATVARSSPVWDGALGFIRGADDGRAVSLVMCQRQFGFDLPFHSVVSRSPSEDCSDVNSENLHQQEPV